MASLRRLWKQFRASRDPLMRLDEGAWLARAKASAPAAVAVVEPAWRGIYSSTCNLFPVVLPVRDALTRRWAAHVASLLIESGARKVVISGFPLSFVHLIEALRQAPRKIAVHCLWHGSFVQSNEGYNWRSFVAMKELAARGAICKVGFVKTGMAEAFLRLGIPASFVLNAIDRMPPGPSQPKAGGPHLGIWAVRLAQWRKLPYAMLVAVGELPGAVVHVSGADDRVAAFIREMRVSAEVTHGAVPQHELPRRMAPMHVNLYVTFSECCPMVPMESLAEGVPCLLGPNSHLFEDEPYLHRRLVVPYPDRHEIIAQHIRGALEERNEIVTAYRRWLPGYVQQSKQSVAEFLDQYPSAERARAA